MFGNKLATAQTRIAALVGMLAATGFKIEADAETIPTLADFQAHLEARDTAASQAALRDATAGRAAAEAVSGAYAAAIKGAGIALEGVAAGDFTAQGDQPAPAVAKIKTAIETAVAQRAARQVAGAGHPAAVETPAGESEGGATAADTVPANKAEFAATWAGLKKTDPKAAAAYFRKHEGKFPVR